VKVISVPASTLPKTPDGVLQQLEAAYSSHDMPHCNGDFHRQINGVVHSTAHELGYPAETGTTDALQQHWQTIQSVKTPAAAAVNIPAVSPDCMSALHTQVWCDM
jgi:hypothetical protein